MQPDVPITVAAPLWPFVLWTWLEPLSPHAKRELTR